MEQIHTKKIRKRIYILLFFFVLWVAGLLFRLIQLQVIQHPQLEKEVSRQNQKIEPIFPKRGAIFDRKGHILTRSIPRKSVFLTPYQNESAGLQYEILNKLKRILNLSVNEIRLIKAKIKNKDTFIWIKRKIDPHQAAMIEKLRLDGVHFLEENKRFYPQGPLAAPILGRVNIDNKGTSGIEYRYNNILQGKKGKRIIRKDAKKRKYRFEILRKSEPGKDLYLTIDETIQYICEKELHQTMIQTQAKWGTVIVSIPSTGEILAMANYPTYNPNHLPDVPLELDRNCAIHHTFEPGSTFKVVTFAAALESKMINLNETFDCSKGSLSLDNIAYSDYKTFNTLSFPEVIIYSSNVGTVKIGQKLGKDIIFDNIKSFGFGEKTGIDLPAEEKGILRPLDNWSRYSVASISIGYEISTTAIQMLQAINIIANDGILVKPIIVKHEISQDYIKEKSNPSQRIISKETANKLAAILKKVVSEGTGKPAGIKGYKVAGKTGTAQKYNKEINGYSSLLHTASFIGFLPLNNPSFSIIVVIDEPKGEYYGGKIAAPVFKKIATQILRYMNIPNKEKLSKGIITAKLLEQSS
ncbi:MAG: peptidoglycan D,D-transpeptidase FtsI family protein [Candidatus Aminicenantaceae bacterium]